MNTYAYVGGNPVSNADPTGLVAWNGTMHSRSLIGGVGAGYITFTLTSDCVDDQKATIDVIATGPGLGVGFDIAETRANITFEDYRDAIEPHVFGGGFGAISAGLVVGPYGGSIGKVRLGDAFQVDGDGMKGLDIGLAAVFGSSTVIETKWEECGCAK